MKTNLQLPLIAMPVILIGTLSLLYFGVLAPDMPPDRFSVSLVSLVTL